MSKEGYITSDPCASSFSNETMQEHLKEHKGFLNQNYSFRTASYVNHAKLIAHKKHSSIIASGYKSRLIALGDESWLIALGDDSVLIAIGINCKFILAKGCTAVICWSDGKNIHPSIIREGENGIKAFVPYQLKGNGEVVEVQENANVQ